MNRFNFEDFQLPNDHPIHSGGASNEVGMHSNLSWGNHLKGNFLVASPGLEHTPFERTVVLVLQNDPSGTFGVVLNRPANNQILSVWHQMAGTRSVDENIVHGGPVGGPIFAIHPYPSLGDMEMSQGVFVSAGQEALQELVKIQDDRYRIVFGIAAWKPGQLFDEVQSGLWYPLDADAEDVFGDPQWLWEKSFQRYGNQVLSDVVGVKGFPFDPTDN